MVLAGLEVSALANETSSDEIAKIFDRNSRALCQNIAQICVLDRGGRVESHGTVTFAADEGQAVMLTAEHVVTGVEGRSPVLFIADRRSGSDLHRALPRVVPLELKPLFRDSSLDVAVLEVPTEVLGSVRFFDISDRDSVAHHLRAHARQRLASAILGFPAFGHVELPEHSVALNLGVPILGHFSGWIQDWQGDRAPQIIVDVHAEHGSLVEPRSDLEAITHKRIFSDFGENSSFGGFSGGPALLLTPEAYHLVGIVKEGGLMYGKPIAYASTIVDIEARMNR